VQEEGMQRIDVHHVAGDRFRIAVRGHEVVVDQSIADGGEDLGPTPTELFVASLASCVAFYGGRFCRRHGVDPAGLTVSCDFEMASDRPARVSAIEVRLSTPPGFPEEKLPRLQAVVDHCTVHNSIIQRPAIDIHVGVHAGV
jgi:putative redox protein